MYRLDDVASSNSVWSYNQNNKPLDSLARACIITLRKTVTQMARRRTAVARDVVQALDGLEGEGFLRDLHERIQQERERQEASERRLQAVEVVKDAWSGMQESLAELGYDIDADQASDSYIIISEDGELWMPPPPRHVGYDCDDDGVWSACDGSRGVPTIYDPDVWDDVLDGVDSGNSATPSSTLREMIPDNSTLRAMRRGPALVLLALVVAEYTFDSVAREIGVTGTTVRMWIKKNENPDGDGFSSDPHHFSRVKGFLKRYRDGTAQANLRPAGTRSV